MNFYLPKQNLKYLNFKICTIFFTFYREPRDQTYSGKITRPFRPHRTLSPLRDNTSAHAPAPTPASNVRPRNLAKRDDQVRILTSRVVCLYERSVILYRCLLVHWNNNAQWGTWGLPPPVNLESPHITFTVLVRRKTKPNNVF